MSTLILVTSHGLSGQQVAPFLTSLRDSGYNGDLGIISNDLEVAGAIQFPWYENKYFRSSRRLFQYAEFFQREGWRWDKIILSGIRDVLFQSNPEKIQLDGLNIFQEHFGPTIEECPYNSKWIRNSYGEDVFIQIKRKPIICAEIVIGDRRGADYFLEEMVIEAENNPRKSDLEDQAMLNKKYWLGELEAKLHQNENSPIYTVGYMPYIKVSKHRILNMAGEVVPVVHQYDRHI